MLPSHVLVSAGEGGLTQDSIALWEQIRVLDIGRLMTQLGALSAVRMQEIGDALRIILDL
jgi:mRNA interferase MazF